MADISPEMLGVGVAALRQGIRRDSLLEDHPLAHQQKIVSDIFNVMCESYYANHPEELKAALQPAAAEPKAKTLGERMFGNHPHPDAPGPAVDMPHASPPASNEEVQPDEDPAPTKKPMTRK
jgi:hypothetical protein